jgi:3-hydroxyacyl-CoA dehydrogenase
MDRIVTNSLFTFGIFDFCDSVGIDTMLASVENYTRDYPHKSYYADFLSALSELVSAGRLGMKTNRGFYDYPLPETHAVAPTDADEIAEHLRQTWISSSKRHTATAHLPIDDANSAIREYFDIDKGPFDL